MKLLELRKEYKEVTGIDWDEQIGMYVNFLERRILNTYSEDKTIDSNICDKCNNPFHTEIDGIWTFTCECPRI